MNDETQQPTDETQPQEPQPPVDQHPSSTADSEDTGGSSPEPSDEAADAAEDAPVVESPEAVSDNPLRPAQGSTNPKTAGPPPPGVPLEPVNAVSGSLPVPKRPASRIKEAQRRKKEQREANLSD